MDSNNMQSGPIYQWPLAAVRLISCMISCSLSNNQWMITCSILFGWGKVASSSPVDDWCEDKIPRRFTLTRWSLRWFQSIIVVTYIQTYYFIDFLARPDGNTSNCLLLPFLLWCGKQAIKRLGHYAVYSFVLWTRVFPEVKRWYSWVLTLKPSLPGKISALRLCTK